MCEMLSYRHCRDFSGPDDLHSDELVGKIPQCCCPRVFFTICTPLPDTIANADNNRLCVERRSPAANLYVRWTVPLLPQRDRQTGSNVHAGKGAKTKLTIGEVKGTSFRILYLQ